MQLDMMRENNLKDSPNVLMTKDSFEHILNCLDNQKFIYDINADALTMDYKKVISENQQAIDSCCNQIVEILPRQEWVDFSLKNINEPEMKRIGNAICVSNEVLKALVECFVTQKKIVELIHSGEKLDSVYEHCQKDIDFFNKMCRNFWLRSDTSQQN